MAESVICERYQPSLSSSLPKSCVRTRGQTKFKTWAMIQSYDPKLSIKFTAWENKTYRCFVQNFDGVLICNVSLPESLFQRPEWERLPFAKNYQVNVTGGKRKRETCSTLMKRNAYKLWPDSGSAVLKWSSLDRAPSPYVSLGWATSVSHWHTDFCYWKLISETALLYRTVLGTMIKTGIRTD